MRLAVAARHSVAPVVFLGLMVRRPQPGRLTCGARTKQPLFTIPRMFDEDATSTPAELLERVNAPSIKVVKSENGAVALPAFGALLVRLSKNATYNADSNIVIARSAD